jgi:chemotaxis protein histidine kinase CheA
MDNMIQVFLRAVTTHLSERGPSPPPQAEPQRVTAAMSVASKVPFRPRIGFRGQRREGRYTRVSTEELDQMQGLAAEVVIGRHRIDRAISEYRALWQELERLRDRVGGLVDGFQEAVGENAWVARGRGTEGGSAGEIDAELTDLLVALKANFSRLCDHANSLARTTDGLQDQVCRARMVEVGSLFQRFHKLTREAGQEFGKECELEIQGGETRLDKVVVERIFDPLIHLVRNAIAHGIEPTHERVAQGKPRTGRIVLSGQQQGDGVVIRVSDDGAGIDPGRIVASAVKRGLVHDDEAAEMGEEEVVELIFRPGFSTREGVDGLAGRGVGMDVVRDAVVGLRGRITIQSTLGVGTTFLLRLPVSLAVTRGLFFRVGDIDLALPLSCIEGVAAFAPHELGHDGATATFKDERFPILSLCRWLGMEPTSIAAEVPVLLVAYDDQKLAIQVDSLCGQREMVLHPMSQYLERLRWFSATTVSASGRVRLVLDVGALFAAAAGQ